MNPNHNQSHLFNLVFFPFGLLQPVNAAVCCEYGDYDKVLNSARLTVTQTKTLLHIRLT